MKLITIILLSLLLTLLVINCSGGSGGVGGIGYNPNDTTYSGLGLGANSTGQQMWSIPDRNFRVVPRSDWGFLDTLDPDLISYKNITAPNTELDKLTYHDTIASLTQFITFCQTHHTIDSSLWFFTFSDSPNSTVPPWLPANWNRVRAATVIGQVPGYTTYTLDFIEMECRYYRMVAFSNGVVFVNASCGK